MINTTLLILLGVFMVSVTCSMSATTEPTSTTRAVFTTHYDLQHALQVFKTQLDTVQEQLDELILRQCEKTFHILLILQIVTMTVFLNLSLELNQWRQHLRLALRPVLIYGITTFRIFTKH